ncbi:MAG: hypothetical protein K9I26_04785 [Flavobacterium sp.]|nr:hypothetical protein [Flavobacterium sp.]
METCKKCDIKFNGTNCPICGKKKSSGGILEGILLVTAIIFAILVVASTGGVFAVIIYILFYKSINEKYKLLLANTCLVLGLFIGTAIFKYTEKLPVEYETYKTIGIGLLILMGYYSYKFMYKSAMNNSKGLWTNIENIVTTKSYTGKTKEFLNALENDKEYQEKLQSVKRAVKEIDKYGEAAVKAKEKADKSYEEYAKKYGKTAADNMRADIKANKFKWGRWTDDDRKRYSGK